MLAYRDMDSDGSGSIDYNEFQQAIGPDGLNAGLTPSEIDDLFIALDTDGSGDVSVQEFLHELMIADKPPEELMIDRGRRMTLNWMERNITIAVDKQQAVVEQAVVEQAAMGKMDKMGKMGKQVMITEERQESEEEEKEKEKEEHGVSPHWHCSSMTNLDMAWEHPLQTKRPSTSNSEYGSGSRRSTWRSSSERSLPSVSPVHRHGSQLKTPMTTEKKTVEAKLSKSKEKKKLDMNMEDARVKLKQRPFGGKCYKSSPKFYENKETWKKIGYGSEGGVQTQTHLYHPESSRRSPLRVAPLFPHPEQRNDQATRMHEHALAFLRPEKGILHQRRPHTGIGTGRDTRSGTGSGTRIGGAHNVFATPCNRSHWEMNRGFLPLETKKKIQKKVENRVNNFVKNHDAKLESQEKNRVLGKSIQQFQYYVSKMEDPGYLNRQRGTEGWCGKGLLRSDITKDSRGGRQVASAVRGVETLWLGESLK